MRKSRFFLVSLVFFAWSLTTLAQETTEKDDLFSPSVGQKFYEIAYEIRNLENINENQAEQGLIFLNATANLDVRASYILPDIIKLAGKFPEQDYSELMHKALTNYVETDADLGIASEAIRYLLARLNSREEREQLVLELLNNLEGKNDALESELATLMGLLMAEKADAQTAQFLFMQAFNKNKYNKLAFAKMAELTEIEPAVYLEHLRVVLGENPFNIEAALTFAQYAEGLQLYDTAAEAYEYSKDLHRFSYPAEPLPAQIYLPWVLSNYNSKRGQHKCLQIAAELREGGQFDLFLEAIAGKAAAKIGDSKQAEQILRAAEDKANLNIMAVNLDKDVRAASYERLAWFNCFTSVNADKALDWANKAYSADPDSTIAAALLAYSLVMNGQTEWAKSLIDNYDQNQISILALGQIQLAEGQKDQAIETLKSAIAKDPGSLEAQKAKDILAENGTEYIAPIDPEIVRTVLRNTYGEMIVPKFIQPEQMISTKLNLRGTKFSYGGEFGGSVAITNNSTEPLVVSDDGLFTGNIRIDADITGDINKRIANLVSVKIQPSSPIGPGKSLFIPLRFITGKLRQILQSYPQASLDIKFILYIDPIETSEGLVNRISDLEPEAVVVKRPGVKLTGRYLQNRFNSLSKGRQGQKLRTIRLFAGLLTEQYVMVNREPFYDFKYADWMPNMLKSAVLQTIADDDWVVRVYTMAEIMSLPLDYELVNALSENLNDSHWPVRLMAVHLLAKNQDGSFNKVLDWTAKYDSNELVRNMAIALGGAKPPEEIKELPPEPMTGQEVQPQNNTDQK